MKQKYTQDQVIGLKEFRLDTEKYIKEVGQGGQFLVVKRSKPVFRLEPVNDTWQTLRNFVQKDGGGVEVKKLLQALKRFSI